MKMMTTNDAEADGDWRRVQKPQLNLEANLPSKKKKTLYWKNTLPRKKRLFIKTWEVISVDDIKCQREDR